MSTLTRRTTLTASLTGTLAGTIRPLLRPLAAVAVGVTLFAGIPAVSATAATTVGEKPGISVGIPTPTAATTGVPAGTVLRVHQGDLKITTPGTIVDGLDVRGLIWVQAANVTIKNTIVRGRTVTANTGLINAQFPEVKNLTIDRVELSPTVPSVRLTGIYGHNLTIQRSNIHHVVDGIHLLGDNVRIHQNFVHDLSYFAQDPAHNNTPTHNDDIQIQKGNSISIKDNVLTGAANAALQITQDQGLVSAVVIENNIASGGGCTLNIAEKGKGAIKGLQITDNTFGTSKYNCNAILDKATRTITTITNNNRTDGKTTTIMTR